MTTIYISHRSPLVAFFVAASIKLYFRHRSLRIVIVEVFRTRKNASRPFCGVSTVSNLRMPLWPFLYNVLLLQIASPALFFAQSVQVLQGAPSTGMSPELPMWRQYLKVLARGGNSSKCLALFYWPEHLEHVLFRYLAQSDSVSFMSVHNHNDIPSVIQNTSRNDLSPDVWMHFGSGDFCNKRVDLDVLASAHMAGFQTSEAEHHHNGENLENLEIFQHQHQRKYPRHMQAQHPSQVHLSSVLWLPQFKGVADMFSEPIFNRQTQHTRGLVLVNLAPLNLDISEEAFLADHDLLYALKTCNSVLETLNALLGVRALDVTPWKI